MNWIKETVLPKFKAFVKIKEPEEVLWIKCKSCSQMIFHKEFSANNNVCKTCGFHDHLSAKERIELFKTAGKDVLSSLVPVLEDFKRAISQEGSNSDDEGINLIYNKFNETLKNQGLIEVEVNLGDVFDAEIHEAISQIPAKDESQKGKIIDIIQGGYKIGDNIITYPKVVVAQ